MKIVVGADHRGFLYKEQLKTSLHTTPDGRALEWLDVGAYDQERSDYPLFVKKACQALLQGQVDAGILLCGSGIGMSIAANRYPKIYAGLVWNEKVARQSKEDDNTNMLIIPADFISLQETIGSINVWLSARFKGGRYQERITMIDSIK